MTKENQTQPVSGAMTDADILELAQSDEFEDAQATPYYFSEAGIIAFSRTLLTRAQSDQAVRNAALEQAAKTCDQAADRTNRPNGELRECAAAIRALQSTPAQQTECKHDRQTTTALGAITGTGWKCKDCGKLLSESPAPDQARQTAPELKLLKDALQNIRDCAAFDTNGGMYYNKAENALSAAEQREAIPAPENRAQQTAPVTVPILPGISRDEWHDKAWSLYHAKTFDDTQLAKVNIHTMRAVFNATYDALASSNKEKEKNDE